MKTEDMHQDARVSGILEIGAPRCRPCFRRLTAFGASLVALLGGVVVESASADGWSMIDGGFATPPAEFRLGQYSAHDGALLPVEQMAAAGIGGVKLFMQSDGYLQTEQAWANVSNNIAAVKAAGLQLWMADDNGYPSGMAGGRVVEADPAYEARCLIEVKLDGRGRANPFTLTLPAGAEKFVYAYLYPRVNGLLVLDQGVAVPVQTNVVTGTGIKGPWTLRAYALQINDESTQATSTAAAFQTSGRYPDLLDPAAMQTLVSLTHEEYAERFGPLQGKIDAFYSNEPNLMTLWWSGNPAERPGGVSFLPWDGDLSLRFQERHGYDMRPFSPSLFTGATDETSKLVRRHFYETVGAVLAQNFSQRIANWADQNGVLSAGHPLQEEDLYYHVIHYGDMFRFVEPLHVASCDVPMPDRGATWNYWMPKFLSSVAQFKNRPIVSALLDPLIYRSQPNLTPLPQDFRRIVNMAVFSGVNQFQTYLYWDQYDPATYRGMSEYLGRLSLALRGARNAATVGLYYPIETFQANFIPAPDFWTMPITEWQTLRSMQGTLNNAAQNLCKAGIDFNWLHGDWIRNAVVEGGVLVVGSHRYSTVVLPRVELLPLPVAQKLEQFRQAGGKVVLVESKPVLGDSASEHATVAALYGSQPVVAVANLVTELGAVVPPDFSVRVQPPVDEGSTQEFFSARFVRDGRRITYLVNNGITATAPTLTLAGGAAGRVAVYNPLDGSITGHNLPGTLTIAPSSSLLVVENPATVPSTNYQPTVSGQAVINGDFSDRTGMTNTSTDWSGGFPPGWSGGKNSAYAVGVFGGVAYANLGELTSAAPFNPITQQVGTVEATTDVRLTFTLANLQSGASTVGVAIYGPDRLNLGNTSFINAGTFTHTVKGVASGTPLEIAFWGVSKTPAMGLTGVELQLSESAFGWNGGAGGVWIDGGAGWLDNLDGIAAVWNNAKPVIAHFTNPALGANVTVAPAGVIVSDLQFSNGNFNLSGGAVTMTDTSWLVAAGSSASVASSLSGSRGLIKTGDGALVLTGSNNYSGPTVVESGRLVIDGDHSTIIDDVVVRPGAALGGAGVLGRDLAFDSGSGWSFQPGSGLTVTGAVIGGFDVSQVQNLHSATPVGRYRLINGAIDPAEFSPIGQDAAMDIGGVRRAWFEIGPASLDLVVASAAQSFAGWLQQYELSGVDAAMTAAPAGDGISNLLKYAFNLDPTRNEGSGRYPSEYRGLPHFTASTGGHLEMFYYRDTAKPDIDITPVWSSHLEETPGWTEVLDLQLIGTQGGVEHWRARIPLDEERRFMRIEVNKK
jgi:autotransporter-associated beta strand protein